MMMIQTGSDLVIDDSRATNLAAKNPCQQRVCVSRRGKQTDANISLFFSLSLALAFSLIDSLFIPASWASLCVCVKMRNHNMTTTTRWWWWFLVGVWLLVFGTYTLVGANPNDECLVEEKPVEPLPPLPTLLYSLTATSTTNGNRMRNELNAMVQQQQPQPQQDSANTNQNDVLLLAVYFDETTRTFSIHAVFDDSTALTDYFTTVVVPKLDQWMQFTTFGTFVLLDGSETARQAIAGKGLTVEWATLDKGMERALLCCDMDGDSGLEPPTRWLHGTHNDNEQCDPADHVRQVPALTERVFAIYQWTALDPNTALDEELHDTYDDILAHIEESEPETLSVRYYRDPQNHSVFVRNEFASIPFQRRSYT